MSRGTRYSPKQRARIAVTSLRLTCRSTHFFVSRVPNVGVLRRQRFDLVAHCKIGWNDALWMVSWQREDVIKRMNDLNNKRKEEEDKNRAESRAASDKARMRSRMSSARKK